MSFSLIAILSPGAYIRTWSATRDAALRAGFRVPEGGYADWGLRIRIPGHAGISLPGRFRHAGNLLPSGQLAHGRNGSGQCSVFREKSE